MSYPFGQNEGMKKKSESRKQKTETGDEGNGAARPLIEALGIEDVKPWTAAVEGKALLDELKQTLERFVVLPTWGGDTLALWVVHTYAFQLGDVSTYVFRDAHPGKMPLLPSKYMIIPRSSCFSLLMQVV